MSDPDTVPDTAQASTQPPKLTLIVPGLVPGSSGEALSLQRSQSLAAAGSNPGDPSAQGSALAQGDDDAEALLSRFDWQTAKAADTDAVAHRQTVALAHAIPDEPWECTLIRIVGAPALTAEQLPIARLRWPQDMSAEHALPEHIVCADPVHLQVDRDSVSVIPPQALSITREEADACASSINALLSGDGLELVVAAPEHWYLTGGEATGLNSAPTHAVARRTVATSFAEGAASSRWRQLTSELQMLLHSHEVNISRASRGFLPINSVWFCGGEALPGVAGHTLDGRIHSADASVLTLAQALGIATSSPAWLISESASESPATQVTQTEHEDVWVDLSLYRAWLRGDPDEMDAARSTLIRTVIGPALDRLDSGAVSQVLLEAGDGLRGVAVPVARARSLLDSLMTRLLSRLGMGSKADGAGR